MFVFFSFWAIHPPTQPLTHVESYVCVNKEEAAARHTVPTNPTQKKKQKKKKKKKSKGPERQLPTDARHSHCPTPFSPFFALLLLPIDSILSFPSSHVPLSPHVCMDPRRGLPGRLRSAQSPTPKSHCCAQAKQRHLKRDQPVVSCRPKAYTASYWSRRPHPGDQGSLLSQQYSDSSVIESVRRVAAEIYGLFQQ